MKYLAALFHIHTTCGKASAGSPSIETARDVLSALAGDAGFEAFEDIPSGVKGYVQADLFNKEALDNLIETFPLHNVSINYSLEDIIDKDYNEAWESIGFEPFIVNNKIVVHDSLHAFGPMPADAIDITIDARQAFGTGTHETTRMMLSQLAGMQLLGKNVLDCGCGTGILSIAASKLGARHVTAYDIDEWSVRNTMHNSKINNVENIETLHGDASVIMSVIGLSDISPAPDNHSYSNERSRPNGIFDIVMANINRNILLADMPVMRRAMGEKSTLMLSGFYDNDTEALVSKAKTLSLRCTDKTVDNRWCLLLLAPADA